MKTGLNFVKINQNMYKLISMEQKVYEYNQLQIE